MPNRFLMLLVPLVLSIFAQPIVAEGYLPAIVNRVLALLVLVAAFRIFKGDRILLAIIVGLFVVATVTVPVAHSTSGRAAMMIGVIAETAAMVLTLLYIAREAVTEELVTGDTLMGALAVYLLMGIGFAAVFELIYLASPSAYTNLAGLTEAQIHAELVYFSFVTLTTLGYGDIAPVFPLARTLAINEAIIGQFFVAAVIGLLITRHGSQVANRPLRDGAQAVPPNDES